MKTSFGKIEAFLYRVKIQSLAWGRCRCRRGCGRRRRILNAERRRGRVYVVLVRGSTPHASFGKLPDVSDATFGVQNTKFSNDCLPPEDGRDRRETWGKRISDVSSRFIFRHPQHFWWDVFSHKNFNLTNLWLGRSNDFLSVTGRFLVKNNCL